MVTHREEVKTISYASTEETDWTTILLINNMLTKLGVKAKFTTEQMHKKTSMDLFVERITLKVGDEE